MPSVSVAFTDDGGATRIGIELEVRSRVPVAAFELHRTYLPAITAAAAQMGPPIASVIAADSGDPPTPAGHRYTARLIDPSPGDWRTAYYRAVAVPAPGLTLDDQHNGRVGARSPDSSLASLRLPPEAPPSLTLVAVAPFGATGEGVVIRMRTDAPVAPNPLGPFTVRCTTDTGVAVAAVLGELRPTSAATPPAVVGGGAFTRDRRSGGTTELAAWLPRPDPHSALVATVSITDPLGRSSTLVVPVPAEPDVPDPQVTITGVRRAGLNVVVTFTLDAPTVHDPGGDWRLDAFARRTALFGLPAAVSVAVPDIPDAGNVPPNTPGALIVARRRSGGETTYLALVRLLRPFRLRLTLRTPDGRSASADRTVPGGPRP